MFVSPEVDVLPSVLIGSFPRVWPPLANAGRAGDPQMTKVPSRGTKILAPRRPKLSLGGC